MTKRKARVMDRMSQVKGATVALVALVVGLVIGLFIPFGQVSPATTVAGPTVTLTQTLSQTFFPPTPKVETTTLIATETVVKTQTVTETVTSEAKTTETVSTEYVRVLYSPPIICLEWPNSVFEYSPIKPERGEVFAAFYVQIENHGYKAVDADPKYFNIAVNGKVEYEYEFTYIYNFVGKIKAAVLLDGGSIEGWLFFEIPAHEADAELSLRAYFSSKNVEYGQLPPVEPP